MDPDILRLFLLVLGILVVLGIYFWGRTRGKDGRRTGADEGRLSRENEPVFSTLSSEDMDDLRTETEASTPPRIDLELEQLQEIISDERAEDGDDKGAVSSTDAASHTYGVQEDLFPVSEHGARADSPDGRGDALPVKILQINIVASKGRFSGHDILKVGDEIGLRPGEMQILHRYAPGSRKVLFSAANLVEPGSFPLDSMEGFSTPGLTLFAKLPGPLDGMKVYSAMLDAARRLAESLGGGLQDETHSDLTKQTIEHTRAEILEHCRKLALARKKT